MEKNGKKLEKFGINWKKWKKVGKLGINHKKWKKIGKYWKIFGVPTEKS